MANEEKSQNTNRTLLRLEEKLEELGYSQSYRTSYLYFKCTTICTIYAHLNKDKTQCHLYLDDIKTIDNKEDLTNLFQAYNTRETDLKELKKIEKVKHYDELEKRAG